MAEMNTSESGDPDHQFAPPTTPANTDYRHAQPRRPLRIGSPQLKPTTTGRRDSGSSIGNVVVVGVCSSGKSTLVEALKEKGYQAHAVSQEHSYVPHLWQRTDPDVLIYLDASIHTIRGRGRTRWRQALLDEEHRRLHHAREHSDIYIPTDCLSPHDVAARVLTFLKSKERRNEK
jgi:RNase adaptor protein for sRNA GlmZ degradation